MSIFTTLVDDIEQEFGDASVSFVVGNDNRRKRGPRRRIHWYRVGGPIGTNSRAGGALVGTKRVNCAWERRGIIEAHIFSENDDTTEAMLNNLIASVYRTLNTGFDFLDYSWEDDHVNQRGPYVIMRFQVVTPVPNENSDLVTITDEENTINWESPE